jgi:hypothetical protein
MARWVPIRNAQIGDSEHLGRRRFRRPQLIAFTAQEHEPELSHLDFLEDRGFEISVDRLGKKCVDPEVKEFLHPLAAAIAEKRAPKKVFAGWASVQVKRFKNEARKLEYSIAPDPIRGTESEDNEYHALISCPTNRTHLEIALMLRYWFETHGALEGVEPAPRAGTINSILNWFRRLAQSEKNS